MSTSESGCLAIKQRCLEVLLTAAETEHRDMAALQRCLEVLQRYIGTEQSFNRSSLEPSAADNSGFAHSRRREKEAADAANPSPKADTESQLAIGIPIKRHGAFFGVP